jgi:hypothetical protein
MLGTLSAISAQSQSELAARVDLAPGTREESELNNAPNLLERVEPPLEPLSQGCYGCNSPAALLQKS